MHFSSRLTTAIHLLLYIAVYGNEEKITSEVLSETTGVVSVNIRKILGQLKQAGLIQTTPGIGGTKLIKTTAEVTLLDVFLAVEELDTTLFREHEHPNIDCPVGKNIHTVYQKHLTSIEETMKQQMASISLKEMEQEMLFLINEANNA